MSLYADSPEAKVAFAMVFTCLVLANVIGNSLVIIVIIKNKTSYIPMNFLLVNLAVADMMVGLFIAPRFIFPLAFTHPEGDAGTIICKLLTGGDFTWMGGACSVFTLVAIASERYYAVLHPHSHKAKMSRRKLKLTIISCWIGAAVLSLPLFLTIYYEEKKNFCFENWPTPGWMPIAYSSLWWAVAGAFPISTMVLLYSRIIYRLWYKASDDKNSAQQAVLRHRKRATKVMITVSVIYMICWVPVLTYYLLSYADPSVNYGTVLYIACMVLTIFNSTINPVVYTFQNARFRQQLKDLLRCRKSNNQVDPTDVNTTPGANGSTGTNGNASKALTSKATTSKVLEVDVTTEVLA